MLARGVGNPGVAYCVSSNPSSIGYVDLTDATNAGLAPKIAAIGRSEVVTIRRGGRNVTTRRKAFVVPSVTQHLGRGQPAPVPRGSGDRLLGQPGHGRAHPIGITTWILAYSDYGAAGNGGSLGDVRAVLNYATARRRSACSRGAASCRCRRRASPRHGASSEPSGRRRGAPRVSRPGAGPQGPAPVGRGLRRPAGSLLADRLYAGPVAVACLAATAAIAYLVAKTAGETGVWSTYGVSGLVTGHEWVPTPVDGDPIVGTLPFIYGTLVTSAIAMLIAVPAAVGVALAPTAFLPRRLRGPIAATIDLLAAVPLGGLRALRRDRAGAGRAAADKACVAVPRGGR